jgi:hypothetical protein
MNAKKKSNVVAVAVRTTWKKAMSTAFRSPEAASYIKAQNKRESKREEVPADGKGARTTVLYSHRLELTEEQCAAVNKMIAAGWTFICTLFSYEEKAWALLCKHPESDTFGVLYPTGELDRGVRPRIRRVDQWLATTEVTPQVTITMHVPRKKPCGFADLFDSSNHQRPAREDFPTAAGTRTTKWGNE